ncbi:MAG: CRISPR-associated endonuclease Cas2, partial [Deltaproteobacteria bacterium]
MVILLCYDVVEDRRRTRLHNHLRQWLEPVQKSVFEGRIRPDRLGELLSLVEGIIDHDTDSVRIYPLCAGCRPLTHHIGVAEPV